MLHTCSVENSNSYFVCVHLKRMTKSYVWVLNESKIKEGKERSCIKAPILCSVLVNMETGYVLTGLSSASNTHCLLLLLLDTPIRTPHCWSSIFISPSLFCLSLSHVQHLTVCSHNIHKPLVPSFFPLLPRSSNFNNLLLKITIISSSSLIFSLSLPSNMLIPNPVHHFHSQCKSPSHEKLPTVLLPYLLSRTCNWVHKFLWHFLSFCLCTPT